MTAPTQPSSQRTRYTSDGVEITDGLAVFTNEFRVGRIDLANPHSDPDWFDVAYPADESGYVRLVMQNGERVATRFRDVGGKVRVAADEITAR